MASPFSNDPPSRGFGAAGPSSHGSGAGGPPSHGSGEAAPKAEDPPSRGSGEAGNRPEGTTPEPERPVSAAQQRFLSCRWRKAAENGLPDHCGHRDVLPMAGATGFVSDSWCPDCAYFKAKRTPRKREEIDRDRDRDWRW